MNSFISFFDLFLHIYIYEYYVHKDYITFASTSPSEFHVNYIIIIWKLKYITSTQSLYHFHRYINITSW